SMLGGVVLTNISDLPCSVEGFARIHLMDAGGLPLDVRQHDGLSRLLQDGSSTRLRVVLPPHAATATSFGLQWGNWCGARRGPLVVVVTFGSATVRAERGIDLGFDGYPRCDDKAQSSTIDVQQVGDRAPTG